LCPSEATSVTHTRCLLPTSASQLLLKPSVSRVSCLLRSFTMWVGTRFMRAAGVPGLISSSSSSSSSVAALLQVAVHAKRDAGE
jgi:hypothetical protein